MPQAVYGSGPFMVFELLDLQSGREKLVVRNPSSRPSPLGEGGPSSVARANRRRCKLTVYCAFYRIIIQKTLVLPTPLPSPFPSRRGPDSISSQVSVECIYISASTLRAVISSRSRRTSTVLQTAPTRSPSQPMMVEIIIKD